MSKQYMALVEVKEEELDDIFRELEEAKRKVFRCYSRLSELGILSIRKKEEAPSETPGTPSGEETN